jgi:tRNA(fMet)-specific endonuclease VapC
MHRLDTNVPGELMRQHPNPLVEARFESEPEALLTSAICLEEIRYGAKIGPSGNRLWERAEADVLPQLTVLAFDEALARLAGDLRAEWKVRGTPVGYRDGLITATAKAHGLSLVTRNVRHFDHVTGLKVENWFEPPPAAALGPTGPV